MAEKCEKEDGDADTIEMNANGAQKHMKASARGVTWLVLVLITVLPIIATLAIFWQSYNTRIVWNVIRSACIGGMALVMTIKLIPLVCLKTMKRGLYGMDLNKKGTARGQIKVYVND